MRSWLTHRVKYHVSYRNLFPCAARDLILINSNCFRKGAKQFQPEEGNVRPLGHLGDAPVFWEEETRNKVFHVTSLMAETMAAILELRRSFQRRDPHPGMGETWRDLAPCGTAECLSQILWKLPLLELSLEAGIQPLIAQSILSWVMMKVHPKVLPLSGGGSPLWQYSTCDPSFPN
jgi:hypothetical protein